MSRSKCVQWRHGMGMLGFMLGGSSALLGGVTHHIWQTGHGFPITPWILWGIALGFLLARAGVVVDVDRRIATAWWGLRIPFLLNVPFFRRRWGVPTTAKVVLETGMLGANNHPIKAWFAYLEDGPRRKIFHYLGYVRARQEGERLAGALDLPFHDETVHGAPSHRAAGTLDRCLGERLRAAGRSFPKVQPRADAGVEMTREGGSFLFEVSKERRNSLLRVRGRLTVMAVIAATLLLELSLEQEPFRVLLVSVGVVLGVLALVVLRLIHGATKRERLLASPAGLRLERTSAISYRGVEIPAGELEELDVGISRGGTGLMVLSGRSDRTLMEFGARMEKADLEWVREAVLAALYGARESDPPPAGP